MPAPLPHCGPSLRPPRAARLACALALLLPGLAAACERAPDARAARHARLVAAAEPRPELAALLTPGRCRADAIGAARAIGARRDPALAGLALHALLQAQLGLLPNDDDVSEELVEAIVALPPTALADAAAGLPLDGVAAGVRARLQAEWLGPLGGSMDALGADGPALDAALEAYARRWLTAALARPEFRERLPATSGATMFSLVSALETAALLTLAARGPEQDAAAATEALRQRKPHPDVREHARQAVAGLGVGDAGTAPAAAPPLQYGTFAESRVRPLRPAPLPPIDASPLLRPSPATLRPPLQLVLLGAIGVLWLVWLALQARWPQRRRTWHRLGAVLLAPTGLLLLEGALAAAGVDPLADVRPTFDPARAPSHVFATEDDEWVWTDSASARFDAFPPAPDPCELRVVALGASSVHGSGHPARFAWPARLGEALGARLPGWRVRAINAGMGGATSDAVRLYAREALAFRPALLAVSVGANDLNHVPDLAAYRAYGPEDLVLRHGLDRWRTVRLLSGPLSALRPAASFADAHQDATPPSPAQREHLRRLAARNLQNNLTTLVRRAARAGVPTVLLVQGQNEALCGPGSAEGGPPDRGCFPPALRAVHAAVGRSTGAPVVDTPAVLRAQLGEVGWAAYFDTIHPTREGHAVIAAAAAPVAEQLLRRGRGERCEGG